MGLVSRRALLVLLFFVQGTALAQEPQSPSTLGIDESVRGSIASVLEQTKGGKQVSVEFIDGIRRSLSKMSIEARYAIEQHGTGVASYTPPQKAVLGRALYGGVEAIPDRVWAMRVAFHAAKPSQQPEKPATEATEAEESEDGKFLELTDPLQVELEYYFLRNPSGGQEAEKKTTPTQTFRSFRRAIIPDFQGNDWRWRAHCRGLRSAQRAPFLGPGAYRGLSGIFDPRLLPVYWSTPTHTGRPWTGFLQRKTGPKPTN